MSGDKALARAKWLALRYLAARARSRAEIAKYLEKKETPAELIEVVLSYLGGLGYIDDGRFAREYGRYLIGRRGLSRYAVSMELKKKGVSERDITPALDDIFGEEGGDEESVALRVASKKAAALKGVDKEKARGRLVGHLQRRGFSFEVIKKVLREINIY